MLVCAEAITRSARFREESRGAHSRLDFPDPDEEWGRYNIVVSREGDEMTGGPQPVAALDELEPLIHDRRAREHM
jgi:succinate dehydrogenase flavoprotein subunit